MLRFRAGVGGGFPRDVYHAWYVRGSLDMVGRRVLLLSVHLYGIFFSWKFDDRVAVDFPSGSSIYCGLPRTNLNILRGVTVRGLEGEDVAHVIVQLPTQRVESIQGSRRSGFCVAQK